MYTMFLSPSAMLLLLITVKVSKSEDLMIFDNFGDGEYGCCNEKDMVDYAVLAQDRKMDLPFSFTICSSVHLNFMVSAIFFYQLYQEDGKPWFNTFIQGYQRDTNKFQEKVELTYYKELSDIENTSNPMPIMPNSWYHGCTTLDTNTGHMKVVVNGHVIIDQIIKEFANSGREKPKSLEGRLSLFKNFPTDIWYQSRQRLTNLNVFSYALTIDELISKTDGKNCTTEGKKLSGM